MHFLHAQASIRVVRWFFRVGVLSGVNGNHTNSNSRLLIGCPEQDFKDLITLETLSHRPSAIHQGKVERPTARNFAEMTEKVDLGSEAGLPKWRHCVTTQLTQLLLK